MLVPIRGTMADSLKEVLNRVGLNEQDMRGRVPVVYEVSVS